MQFFNVRWREVAGNAPPGVSQAKVRLWLPRSLWGMAMVFAVAALVLHFNGSAMTSAIEDAKYLDAILPLLDVLVPAAIPVYVTVGAMVASRRPGNRIGWVLLTWGTLVAVQEAAKEYAAQALEVAPGSLPAGVLATWLSGVLNPVILLPCTLMLLLFPSGRLLTRRWRFVVWMAVGGVALAAIAEAVIPALQAGVRTKVVNPVGIEQVSTVTGVMVHIGFVVVGFALLAAVLSVVLRWHRAVGQERQQIKWLAYDFAILAVAGLFAVASVAIPIPGISITVLVLASVIGVMVFTIAIPINIAIVILKYRLYDIDLIINRTLVYGSLTALLAGLYFGGVMLGQVLLQGLTGQNSPIAAVASTLMIAAWFKPLRRRVQDFIDRHFYRRKYDVAKTLEAFSATLRSEVDLDELRGRLVNVVEDTMQPEHVSLWLCEDKVKEDGN